MVNRNPYPLTNTVGADRSLLWEGSASVRVSSSRADYKGEGWQ